jgi:hypothetical protein
MSPDIRIAAPHCYTYRTESPLHSEFVGRPPATLEKRIPINCVMAAMDEPSLKASLEFKAEYSTGLSAVRYPRDGVSEMFANVYDARFAKPVDIDLVASAKTRCMKQAAARRCALRSSAVHHASNESAAQHSRP